MRVRLLQRHKKLQAEGGGDLDDWTPPRDLEGAWSLWVLMNATGWRFLPEAGGLLDQSEETMNNLLTISWLDDVIKEQLRGD